MCTKLKVKLSIFYALAIASFLLKVYRSLTMCFSRARTCGNAIVSVSNPGSGLIRGPSIALLDLLLSFLSHFHFPFLSVTHFSLRVVQEGAATSPAYQGGGPWPGSFNGRFNPFVCPGL